jgi:excinuclease ABC subunit A
MSRDTIIIKGAREHNLKGIDVEIPRDQLVVLTGVSGSGKSSLAFDTLYAEGQRRYVESLSSYARQFLGQMEKPHVDFIEGLSPSIAIEQKSASKNPRSTVGTVTEIYDYLRLLFARIGTAHCPVCGNEVGAQTAEQMVDRVLSLPTGTRFLVLAPLVSQRKGEYKDIFNEARAEGFARVRVDGEIYDLSEDIKLNKKVKHTIEVVVDRLVLPPRPPAAPPARQHQQPGQPPQDAAEAPGETSETTQEWQAWVTRLTDSIETSLRTSEGKVVISVVEPGHQKHDRDEQGDTDSGETDGPPPLPEEWLMSETNTCAVCGISFPELSPQMFSFNSPQGACPDCTGLGTRLEVDLALLLPDPTLSLHEGAILYWGELRKKRDSWGYQSLICVGNHYGFDLDTPWERLTEHHQEVILYGSGKEKIRFDWSHDQGSHGVFYRPWEGVRNEIMRRFQQTESNHTREFYAQFMSEQPCPSCGGARLRPESLAVMVGERSIYEACRLNIREASAWLATLLHVETPEDGPGDGHGPAGQSHHLHPDGQQPTPTLSAHPLTPTQRQIAGEVLKEIRDRLQFLLGVGLHYLTLERAAPTLSGGEAQRIRLASQIGSGLVGVTYILDEPSIGLHQRDNRKLLSSLTRLRDLGNTVVVVEHDLETMQSADWIIDFGPGAGVKGGQVVAAGPPTVVQASDTLTGAYLDGRLQIATPSRRRMEDGSQEGSKEGTRDRRKGGRPGKGKGKAENRDGRKSQDGRDSSQQGAWLKVQGASMNNLRDIDVRFPLGCFVAVTGVSGSGKSSLVSETLYPALAARLQRAQLRPGPHRDIAGIEHLDKVINIDQQPIGRTPRSNPATYVKLFDLLRELFAGTPEARLRGYTPGRFSFNLKGGRCEACEGNGVIRIDMQFLPDVWVRCDGCKGKRYNRETLQVKYKGKTIADVLDMDVQTALEFFDNVPRIRRILQTLHDVGLDYIRLGQPATTLSGGEAQRVKLARELARVATGRTLYILDEPTTGLHFADIQNLLKVLHRLVDAGNTVVVIEHNLDVIKTADWVIDLGPEGGDGGGTIVAEGTPEQVARMAASFTGQFLCDVLSSESRAGPTTRVLEAETSGEAIR